MRTFHQVYTLLNKLKTMLFLALVNSKNDLFRLKITVQEAA